MTHMKASDLLSPTEVSAIIGVCLGTLRCWRSRKKNLRYIKRGRMVFYQPDDVETFLNEYSRTEVVDVEDA